MKTTRNAVTIANQFLGALCTVNGHPAQIGARVNGWYPVIAYGEPIIYGSPGLVARVMMVDGKFYNPLKTAPVTQFAG
jgi:hypothetical protein